MVWAFHVVYKFQATMFFFVPGLCTPKPYLLGFCLIFLLGGGFTIDPLWCSVEVGFHENGGPE